MHDDTIECVLCGDREPVEAAADESGWIPSLWDVVRQEERGPCCGKCLGEGLAHGSIRFDRDYGDYEYTSPNVIRVFED